MVMVAFSAVVQFPTNGFSVPPGGVTAQSRVSTVNRPIYAGVDRALVRLRSGEIVCVDTNSLDAIDYLLGWDMEADVLPLFRSFLQPDSVVLDIGANFGLYTAV